MSELVPGLDDLELIGRGGFSVVYSAYQPAFERHVAVKLLECDGTDDEVRATVDRESAAAGRLGAHPNIVTLFDRGTSTDGRPYLVMELLSKGSLHDRARAQPLGIDATIDLATKVGGAVETSHRAGTLHRDIKPHNVLFSAADQPMLVDFGLAVVFGANASSMVPAGFTPAFAAPELLVGHPATVASDVYSLAATLYYALTGSAPVAPTDESYVTFVGRVLSTRPTVPDGLTRRSRDALMAALSVQPPDRPGSVEELVDGFASGSPRPIVVLDDITIDPDLFLPQPTTIEGLAAAGAPASAGRRSRPMLAVAAVLVLSAGIGVGALLPGSSTPTDTAKGERSTTTTTATTVSAPGVGTTLPPRTQLLEMDPGSSAFELSDDLPPASMDTSARLALQLAGLPDLIRDHLGLSPQPMGVPEHERVDVPTRGRTFAANKRGTAACLAMRTRELTMVGVSEAVWASGNVYVAAYLWQFADHDGVTAEQQVADADAAGAMQLGAAGTECSGFGSDGLALDGGVSIAFNDLSIVDRAGLGSTSGLAVRSDTDVPIGPTGSLMFRYAHRMVAPLGDRLLRIDLYSADERPPAPAAVAEFLNAALQQVGHESGS